MAQSLRLGIYMHKRASEILRIRFDCTQIHLWIMSCHDLAGKDRHLSLTILIYTALSKP